MRFRFYFAALAVVAGALLWHYEAGKPLQIDGIVLVIADGTSQELLTATRDYALGAKGRLALEGLGHTAIVSTYSDSDLVTDSGAAATALARGIKADNRVIGQAAPDSSSSPASILDLAKNAGWSTALITDDCAEGATPAPFIVEHGDRNQYDQIAAKMIDRMGNRADIVLGGGSKWFFDRGAENYKGNERAVVQQTQKKMEGMTLAIFDSWDGFRDYVPKDDRPVLGVFYPDQFPYYADRTRTLRLKDMVEKTVALLRARGRPFFLMVEAGLPDKACHLNNAKRAIGEVLELDATIDWLRKNLSANTLLLATTDHNNGGFALNGPPAPSWLKGDQLLGTNPVTGASYFTWASGPGADRKASTTRGDTGLPILETDVDYAQPALIPAKASLHSGGDVWLLGDGPGSENVRGFLDNTDIYRLMAKTIRQE